MHRLRTPHFVKAVAFVAFLAGAALLGAQKTIGVPRNLDPQEALECSGNCHTWGMEVLRQSRNAGSSEADARADAQDHYMKCVNTVCM